MPRCGARFYYDRIEAGSTIARRKRAGSSWFLSTSAASPFGCNSESRATPRFALALLMVKYWASHTRRCSPNGKLSATIHALRSAKCGALFMVRQLALTISRREPCRVMTFQSSAIRFRIDISNEVEAIAFATAFGARIDAY
jgi:hypothetical protein